MKIEFSQPRFTGARFDDHTLPVEVARDLAAYEALVIDLAKHLYMQDHPERVRVPKGFATNFHLDIERIEQGSTKPLLALVMSGALALTGGEQNYFSYARDLISECVAASGGTLPAKFPKELLAHFNQFGRSLRDGETLDLSLPTVANAILTPENRKKLVLAADEEYEREVDLQGFIGEVDWERSTFRLRLADETQVIAPMSTIFRADIRTFGGRPRHIVIAKGVATFDAWDRIKKVVSVESLEIARNHHLSTRFDELAQLQSGWYEGSGLAPDSDQLSSVAERFVSDYPDELALPAIIPTQDGNLLFEWDLFGVPSLDMRLCDSHASYHAFDESGSDIEHDFSLINDLEWRGLFDFLGKNLRKRSA